MNENKITLYNCYEKLVFLIFRFCQCIERFPILGIKVSFFVSFISPIPMKPITSL